MVMYKPKYHQNKQNKTPVCVILGLIFARCNASNAAHSYFKNLCSRALNKILHVSCIPGSWDEEDCH
jgi:hypothetical protein